MRKRAVQAMWARYLIVGLVCLAGVAKASPMQAAELVITNADYPDGSIGPDGLHADVPGMLVYPETSAPFDAFTIGFEHGALTHFGTRVDPTSGTLLYTEYGYADPFVVVSAQWTTKAGVAKSGTFRAPIVETDDDYLAPYSGLFLTIDESPDLTFGPRFIGYLYLGPGMFSKELARRLGVSRDSPSSLLSLILEVVQPGQGQRPFVVYENQIGITVEPAPVPEPTSLLLCLVGGVGLAQARRSVRRRASTDAHQEPGVECP